MSDQPTPDEPLKTLNLGRGAAAPEQAPATINLGSGDSPAPLPPAAGFGAPPASQPPYGQPSYSQPPYIQPAAPPTGGGGQPPYGQQPYGQPPYGQPPYGQQPYGQPPYGQPPYGQSPFVQSPYANQPFGPGAPLYVVPGASGTLASVLRRLGAVLIDGLLLGIVYVIAGFLATESFFGMSVRGGTISFAQRDVLIWTLLSGGISLAYYLTFYSTTGQPLGKKMLGIRVVRKDRQPLDLMTAIKRLAIQFGVALYGLIVGYFLLKNIPDVFTDPLLAQQSLNRYNSFSNVGTLITLIDYLWALRGTERQTLHDVLAGTVVIHD